MSDYTAFISNISELNEDVQKSLDYINWKDYVKSDSKVFVKPNFTFPYYKEGITTNPALLKILLELLKSRANEVIVGESNGGNHSFTADEAFKGHNMYDICKETGVTIKNLSDLPAVYVDNVIQGKKVKVQLPKLLKDEIDCFISVPVLKVHVMTNVSLSIKNLWGCYPDTMRCLHHKNLSRKLTLIAKTVKPRIVLVDGTFALDGHGPMYGTAKKTNLLISSNNPVLSDTLGTKIMGIPIKKVEHLLIAEKEGLGSTEFTNAKINTAWEKFRMHFTVTKTFIDSISYLLFNSEMIAKIVMDSKCTPLIYGVAKHLRNPDEKKVANDIKANPY
jgi:uncharacterized protein (DUF362 family)